MKLFDVINFDIMHMAKIDFVPTICEFVDNVSSFSPILAIGEQGEPTIRIVNVEQVPADGATITSEAIKDLHDTPVRLIKYNPHLNLAVSTMSARQNSAKSHFL